MTDKQNLPALQTKSQSAFSGIQAFEDAQRMAKALCASALVPDVYRGQDGHANALIALEMSQRVGVSPMAVMQNLHIIQGRPSWSSSFIIASLNSCGRFSPLRFDMGDLGNKTVDVETWVGPKGQKRKEVKKLQLQNLTCRVWAVGNDGERLEGPLVTMEMAALEGWLTKNDSKWKTMPDLMLRYRAAAFFGRLYAPDILMGMHSEDEAADMPRREVDVTPPPIATQPPPLKPVTVEAETVDAEVVEPDAPPEDAAEEPEAPQPAEGDAVDRDGIKAELDRMEIEYSSRARTETLAALLEDAKANPATPPPVADEPPPLKPAAPGQPEVNQTTANTAPAKAAPNDIF